MGGRGSGSGLGAGGGIQAALNRLEQLDKSVLSDMVRSPIPKISRDESDMLTKEWSRVKLSERKKLPEEEVDISKVATWQNMVNSNGIARIIKGENTEHQGKNTPAIYAVKRNGNYVLMDGNHRVTADILMGKKKVKIKVYESKK